MAAVLFVGAGLARAASSLLLPASEVDTLGLLAVSAAAVLLGVVIWFLPWDRWHPRASLVLVPIAFLLLALGNHFAYAEPFRYGILFVVAFTWIGLAHPRGTSLLFAPLFAVAYVVPLYTTGSATSTALASLVIVGTACVAIGESMAWVSNRLRHAQADLQRATSEARFHSLVQNSSDVIMILDELGLIRYESPSITRVLGYRPAEHVGRSSLELVHPDDLTAVRQSLDEALRTPGTDQKTEYRMRHHDGSWRVVEAISRNLLGQEPIDGVVVNFRDVSERRELESQLRHQAFHDSLTGLANRALFADRVDHSLARLERHPGSLAVLFIDLDDFKTVNDSLGHATGDALLVAVSEQLRRRARAGDTVARLGGDEFGVLLEDCDADTAVVVAASLLKAIGEPVRIGRRQLSAQASIGVAVSEPRRQTAAELLRNADAAMYVAKRRGRGSYALFRPSMQRAASERFRMKASLEHAMADGQFSLSYQPLIRIGTGKAAGVEALLRWNHPRRGTILPAEFLPLAEESGLIVPLGRWALDEACRQAAAWQHHGGDGQRLAMSVNLSVRQLEDPALADHVAAALGLSGLDPGLLVLEITESVLMRDTAAMVDALRGLKGLGVQLAIDDFGSGYSSLGYLSRLPVDILKIDRSFIASLDDGEDERAVLGSILSLARTLQLETVAEGVEHPAQLGHLRRLGGDLAQGYYFARPMPANELSAFLERPAAALAMIMPEPGDDSSTAPQAAGSLRHSARWSAAVARARRPVRPGRPGRGAGRRSANKPPPGP